jgi:hypothetical protein
MSRELTQQCQKLVRHYWLTAVLVLLDLAVVAGFCLLVVCDPAIKVSVGVVLLGLGISFSDPLAQKLRRHNKKPNHRQSQRSSRSRPGNNRR